MQITCISDTHNFHDKLILPNGGDIILHAGDLTESGTKRELKLFFEWFSKLPFKNKICIAGNHDFFLEKASQEEIDNIIPNNVHYLKESSVVLNGIKFWGSPYIPFEQSWAFTKSHYEIERHWSQIPKDTDVLITHIPPKGILDESSQQLEIGCPSLRKEVKLKKPKVHVFGHIHENYGKVRLRNTTYINATSFFSNLEISNPPIQIQLD